MTAPLSERIRARDPPLGTWADEVKRLEDRIAQLEGSVDLRQRLLDREAALHEKTAARADAAEANLAEFKASLNNMAVSCQRVSAERDAAVAMADRLAAALRGILTDYDGFTGDDMNPELRCNHYCDAAPKNGAVGAPHDATCPLTLARVALDEDAKRGKT